MLFVYSYHAPSFLSASQMELNEDFPEVAPEVTSLTPIFHPNIDDTGQVCLSLWDEWQPRFGLQDVIQVMPQSHHTPGPRMGCSHRTSTHGARTGPMRHRTNFASPYGARRVLMQALNIVNSSYGPRTAKYAPLSIPLRAHKAAVRHPCGSRTGPVRVP